MLEIAEQQVFKNFAYEASPTLHFERYFVSEFQGHSAKDAC